MPAWGTIHADNTPTNSPCNCGERACNSKHTPGRRRAAGKDTVGSDGDLAKEEMLQNTQREEEWRQARCKRSMYQKDTRKAILGLLLTLRQLVPPFCCPCSETGHPSWGVDHLAISEPGRFSSQVAKYPL